MAKTELAMNGGADEGLKLGQGAEATVSWIIARVAASPLQRRPKAAIVGMSL
jgi:hypothetical protein